jgi:hypothetical protein
MVQRYTTFSPDFFVYLIRFDSFFSFSSFRWGYCDALNRVAPVRYNQTRAIWFDLFYFHFPFWSFRFLSSTTSLIVYCEIAYIELLISSAWSIGSQEFFRIGPDGSRPQVFPHLSNLTIDVRYEIILTFFSFLFFSYLFWVVFETVCMCAICARAYICIVYKLGPSSFWCAARLISVGFSLFPPYSSYSSDPGNVKIISWRASWKLHQAGCHDAVGYIF